MSPFGIHKFNRRLLALLALLALLRYGDQQQIASQVGRARHGLAEQEAALFSRCFLKNLDELGAVWDRKSFDNSHQAAKTRWETWASHSATEARKSSTGRLISRLYLAKQALWPSFMNNPGSRTLNLKKILKSGHQATFQAV